MNFRFHTIAINMQQTPFNVNHSAPAPNAGETLLKNATSVSIEGKFMYITFVYEKI
jgi:hypothetical protein